MSMFLILVLKCIPLYFWRHISKNGQKEKTVPNYPDIKIQKCFFIFHIFNNNKILLIINNIDTS